MASRCVWVLGSSDLGVLVVKDDHTKKGGPALDFISGVIWGLV